MIKGFKFLNNGCYPGTVLFSFGNSYDEIMYYLKHLPEDFQGWNISLSEDRDLIQGGTFFALRRSVEERDDQTGEYFNKRIFFFLIITGEFDFSDYAFCKLAHEVVHLCQFFLPDVLDRDVENEAEAYYHTHIMKQAIDELRRVQNIRNNIDDKNPL